MRASASEMAGYSPHAIVNAIGASVSYENLSAAVHEPTIEVFFAIASESASQPTAPPCPESPAAPPWPATPVAPPCPATPAPA